MCPSAGPLVHWSMGLWVCGSVELVAFKRPLFVVSESAVGSGCWADGGGGGGGNCGGDLGSSCGISFNDPLLTERLFFMFFKMHY